MITDTRAELNLRRLALALLGKAPSSISRPGDPLDRAALAFLTGRLGDPRVELRRDTIVALLRLARRDRHRAPTRARRLVRLVRRAILREKDPKERYHLRRRGRVLWGR